MNLVTRTNTRRDIEYFRLFQTGQRNDSQRSSLHSILFVWMRLPEEVHHQLLKIAFRFVRPGKSDQSIRTKISLSKNYSVVVFSPQMEPRLIFFPQAKDQQISQRMTIENTVIQYIFRVVNIPNIVANDTNYL